MFRKFFVATVAALAIVPNTVFVSKTVGSFASAETVPKYYTVYDAENRDNVLFVRAEVENGDQYISGDNKLYDIVSVDSKNKTGVAQFVENVEVPKFGVRPKTAQKAQDNIVASAAIKKTVGVYHTHNDESYFTPDGVDSVYGKGGIHDVGKALVKNFEKCGMNVIYDETLHLPHNSGAYTRSQATAARLLDKGANAIFDIHRDSTPRREYATKVNGKEMSKVRMVVGAANINSDANKNLALKIKGYADEAYPNFVKDIYIGRGNYNQQLTNKAMLFEFGSENVEKELCINSTEPLAKILDVVLYGTENASSFAAEDVELIASTQNQSEENLKGVVAAENKGSLDALWIVLGVLAYIVALVLVAFFTNEKANYAIKRFFSETLAGIFGKKKPRREI